ncbi:amidohydrolase family protein [Myxococcota bacterium]|nr:amidohydrolase family protein [Myxococcota bacterium]
MRPTILAVFVSSVVLASAAPALAAPEPELAIVGAEVHTVSGAVLKDATVLVRGERIVAVGVGLRAPASATVVDAKGKIVTPGLVDAATQIGLVEVSAERATVDASPASPDPVRAAFSARDAIDLRTTLIPVARRHGITSIVSAPDGGLVSGRSAWVDLVAPTSVRASSAVRGPLAMHVNLGAAGGGAVGGSRAVAQLRFREVLEDARVFARSRSAFERNSLYELRTGRLDLAALGPVVDGKMRVIVSVSRAADIEAVLRLAKEERLDVALVGADEGWLVASQLAAAKVPVIVEPLANLPDNFESRNARADNAALLAKAGVQVALTTRSSHQASNLRFALGNAVRAGLSHAEALRGATLVPAQIFGVAADYGSIEPGKLANLVVWTGDPFEPSSFAEVIVVRGERQDPDSRQTRLARRYAERHGLAPKPKSSD